MKRLVRWRRAAVSAVAIAIAGAAAEAAFRIVDGYRLMSLPLRGRAGNVDSRTASPVRPRSDWTSVQVAPGVDQSWFAQDPPARPRYAVEADLQARAALYPGDPITPFFAFNRRYLHEQLCAGSGGFGPLHDFYYYEPVESSAYPTFRHLRHVNPPGWFPTNNFGWRGPDVDARKPTASIRIAFVGASTTIDAFGTPFSHPEFIGHWLNLWMRRTGRPYTVEVINAGRTGIDSRSIAAIVRQELTPVAADLVVFYEGANQFWPGQIVTYRFGRLYRKPLGAERITLFGEGSSAAIRRVERLIDRITGGSGTEPLKPPLSVHWPDGVDEHRPDPFDARLPMDLPRVVSDLDNMRKTVEASGGELAISSFVWLVEDGLRLDPKRHREIYRFLNANYWPLSYAHMRRMADFQNRVFEAYARRRGLPFIDIARTFPRDPDLFDDAIHMNGAGLRIQAWIYLQALVRFIDERIASGRWPRTAAPGPDVPPAFAQPDRRLITAEAVKASCP